MSAESPAEGSRTTTPFHDLTDFTAIPRVTALRLSPDGGWLAAAVQTLSADGKKYLTSLWRVDTGGGPARRLTRSAEGEANPRFLPDGSLLFTSRRPDPGRPARRRRRRWRRPVAASPRRRRSQDRRRPARRGHGGRGGPGRRDRRAELAGAARGGPRGGSGGIGPPGIGGLRGVVPPARTKHRRGRRQVAQGTRRRRGDGHLARVGAGQVLGSRPRPGSGPAVLRRPGPAPGPGRYAARPRSSPGCVT